MALAQKYLDKRDYLRATIYAQEGFISRGLERNRDEVDDYASRDEFKRNISESAFHELRKLRNAMAHGLKNARSKEGKTLKDEMMLATTIEQCIGKLKKSV